jgi:LPXTG-motif cell wall-anchored protein
MTGSERQTDIALAVLASASIAGILLLRRLA